MIFQSNISIPIYGPKGSYTVKKEALIYMVKSEVVNLLKTAVYMRTWVRDIPVKSHISAEYEIGTGNVQFEIQSQK